MASARAPGVQFAPTDAILIQKCLSAVEESAAVSGDPINRYDIYTRDPSSLPFEFVHGPHRNEAYFYSPRHPIAHRSTAKANNRRRTIATCCKISRSVPAGPNTNGGVWNSNGDTEILDKEGRLIGHRSSFTFKTRTSTGETVGTGWMMYEYRRANDHKDGIGHRLCKIYNKNKLAADAMITIAEFEAAASADVPYYKPNHHMSCPSSSGDVPVVCSSTTLQSGGCVRKSRAKIFLPPYPYPYPSQRREKQLCNYLEGQGGYCEGMVISSSRRDITTGRRLLHKGGYREEDLRQQESPNMSFTLQELDALDSQPMREEGPATAQSNIPSPAFFLPVAVSDDRATVTELIELDCYSTGTKLSDRDIDQEPGLNGCMSDFSRYGDDGSSSGLQFGSLQTAASSTLLDQANNAAAKDTSSTSPGDTEDEEWKNFAADLSLLLEA